MGFPIGYTEVFLPKLLIHMLSFLGLIRTFILSIFRFMGLSVFLEPDLSFPEPDLSPTEIPVSAILIRRILPVLKYEDILVISDDPPESCAVCLYDFESGDEIRCLKNCKHVFHMSCLDRWMDHDQKTCPLCRTSFVPDEMRDEFNQRLWAASGVGDLYSEYSSITGL